MQAMTSTKARRRSDPAAVRSLTRRSRGYARRLSMTAIAVLLFFDSRISRRPAHHRTWASTPTPRCLRLKYLPLFSEGHLLRTGQFGRDQLARFSLRRSGLAGIGFMSALLALVIGVTLGVLTGYYAGIIDDTSILSHRLTPFPAGVVDRDSRPFSDRTRTP